MIETAKKSFTPLLDHEKCNMNRSMLDKIKVLAQMWPKCDPNVWQLILKFKIVERRYKAVEAIEGINKRVYSQLTFGLLIL